MLVINEGRLPKRRGKSMNIYRKINERFRILGLWPTMKYLFFTVFLEKLGFRVEAVYVFTKDDSSDLAEDGSDFRVIRSIDELDDKDKTSLVEYGGAELIQDFIASFLRGELCALGFSEQRLGCVCWAKKIENHPLNVQQPAFLIWRCFTLPDLRGRGLYPLTLRYFCSMLINQDAFTGPILIECSVFNKSSLQGIHKAGFRYKGKILRFGSWSKTLK